MSLGRDVFEDRMFVRRVLMQSLPICLPRDVPRQMGRGAMISTIARCHPARLHLHNISATLFLVGKGKSKGSEQGETMGRDALNIRADHVPFTRCGHERPDVPRLLHLLRQIRAGEILVRRPERYDEPLYVASKITCILHRPLRYDEMVLFTAVDKIGVRSVGFIIAVDTGDERAASRDRLAGADPRGQAPVPLPEVTQGLALPVS